MHFPHLLLGIAFAVPLCAVAQERTASGNLQTEASWLALENRIGRTDGNVQMLKAELNAMKTCNAKGMMYAPGSAGADANGCFEGSSDRRWWIKGGTGGDGMIYDYTLKRNVFLPRCTAAIEGSRCTQQRGYQCEGNVTQTTSTCANDAQCDYRSAKLFVCD